MKKVLFAALLAVMVATTVVPFSAYGYTVDYETLLRDGLGTYFSMFPPSIDNTDSSYFGGGGGGDSLLHYE